MRTISVSVSKEDYEAFRRWSRRRKRSIAQLIREAMSFYREEKLEGQAPLTELPVLFGHRPLGNLPTRGDLYDEVFERASEPRP